MAKITIQTLLDAGCHYGHQTRRWDPKMKPYIFGDRNGIYILDLKQTMLGADRAYTFLKDTAAKGGTILFVGTKKQAQEPIATQAARCGMPYISQRWLGGMLTNFVTMRSRITRMEELEAMVEDGRMATLPKKEQALLGKELDKLQKNLGGVRDMTALPQAIFVVDTKREEIGVREANRLHIPVVGLLDTNSLMCELAADAVLAGTGKEQITAEEMATPAAPASEAPVAEAPAPAAAPAPEAAPAPAAE
jgi:small subunit ribosomal protein S2